MTEINYPLAGIFVLIALCLVVWLSVMNQKDKNDLRKIFPGHRLSRKRAKKNNLHM